MQRFMCVCRIVSLPSSLHFRHFNSDILALLVTLSLVSCVSVGSLRKKKRFAFCHMFQCTSHWLWSWICVCLTLQNSSDPNNLWFVCLLWKSKVSAHTQETLNRYNPTAANRFAWVAQTVVREASGPEPLDERAVYRAECWWGPPPRLQPLWPSAAPSGRSRRARLPPPPGSQPRQRRGFSDWSLASPWTARKYWHRTSAEPYLLNHRGQGPTLRLGTVFSPRRKQNGQLSKQNSTHLQEK